MEILAKVFINNKEYQPQDNITRSEAQEKAEDIANYFGYSVTIVSNMHNRLDYNC